jgi:hypothetical protein
MMSMRTKLKGMTREEITNIKKGEWLIVRCGSDRLQREELTN